MSNSLPSTLGQLRESGWVSRPVKEEIRRNAIEKIKAGEVLFPGVLGYEETVLPQLENALLAGHDVIFLGERGQAKTRIIRSLTDLLDDRDVWEIMINAPSAIFVKLGMRLITGPPFRGQIPASADRQWCR